MTITQYVFTVGHEDSYDRGLVSEKPLKKLGKREPCEAFPEGYEGGWVWPTPQRARAWLMLQGLKDYAVYELELPGTWLECVTEHEGQPATLNMDVPISWKVCEKAPPTEEDFKALMYKDDANRVPEDYQFVMVSTIGKERDR